MTTSADIDEHKRAGDERWQANEQLAMAQRLSATGSFTSDLVADKHIWSEELYRICEFELGSTDHDPKASTHRPQ